MKKIPLKVRRGIISRFFESYKELPEMITLKGNENGWQVFRCNSANYTCEIAYKANLHNQFIKWDD